MRSARPWQRSKRVATWQARPGSSALPASDGAFLNVTRSAKGQRWEARPLDTRLAEAIAQRHELPEILGRVMAARGVGLDDVENYLNPTLRGTMPKPSSFMDMERGAARLAAAIVSDEKIGV